jgi:histone acetyltransferase 1
VEDADLLVGEDMNLIAPFNPAFTYPIFGEHEKLFGYTDLDIQLQFASGSLKQYLGIEYSEKLKSTVTPPDDIEGKLFEFIPKDYTKSDRAFERLVEQDALEFRPMGEQVGSYARAAAEAKGKGKGKAKAKGQSAGRRDAKEDDEGAVIYEMYKVRPIFMSD